MPPPTGGRGQMTASRVVAELQDKLKEEEVLHAANDAHALCV
jgi:hypothetical protein